jgi:diguanylate cyclase (GGDEF)-like protein
MYSILSISHGPKILSARAKTSWQSSALHLVLVFLAFHLLLSLLLPRTFSSVSTFCIVIAQLAALIACFYNAGRSNTPSRNLWYLLALSIVLHATAILLDVRAELFNIGHVDQTSGLQFLLSTLDTVPLLLCVSLPSDRRLFPPIRILQVSVAVVTGILFYILVFSVVSHRGTGTSAGLHYLAWLFEAANLYLAVAASIRMSGGGHPRERRFFYILTLYLWASTLLPALHNRLVVHHNSPWLDVLISAPYLLLLSLTLQSLPAFVGKAHPSPMLARIVRSGSPIFLSLGLLMLSILVSRHHFVIGASAGVFAILCYGALNVLILNRRIELTESLLASRNALQELVNIDALTGIANRRTFDQAIERECHAVHRVHQPLSLLMIDVDFFKQLNDERGHLVGDDYLVRIAHALQSALPRATDLIARYGGEEFAAILPGTSSAGALAVAPRLHRAIEDLALPHAASPTGIITISIGCSTVHGPKLATPSDLMDEADRALYQAKSLGRNRTELVQPPTERLPGVA